MGASELRLIGGKAMEKLLDVLAELKEQKVAIVEKGELQWTGLAQDFPTYYYDTRNVVNRRQAEFGLNIIILELD